MYYTRISQYQNSICKKRKKIKEFLEKVIDITIFLL